VYGSHGAIATLSNARFVVFAMNRASKSLGQSAAVAYPSALTIWLGLAKRPLRLPVDIGPSIQARGASLGQYDQ
jgi:hypothetical protein